MWIVTCICLLMMAVPVWRAVSHPTPTLSCVIVAIPVCSSFFSLDWTQGSVCDAPRRICSAYFDDTCPHLKMPDAFCLLDLMEGRRGLAKNQDMCDLFKKKKMFEPLLIKQLKN